VRIDRPQLFQIGHLLGIESRARRRRTIRKATVIFCRQTGEVSDCRIVVKRLLDEAIRELIQLHRRGLRSRIAAPRQAQRRAETNDSFQEMS
jgi:hypothetical protein